MALDGYQVAWCSRRVESTQGGECVSGTGRYAWMLMCMGGALLALAIGACGDSDTRPPARETPPPARETPPPTRSSGTAKEGDCIDAQKEVVDCSSPTAKYELGSDQDAPDATACIQIDDPPEVKVKVGKKTFCAQPK